MSKGKKNNRRFEEIATRVQKILLSEGAKGIFLVVAKNDKTSVATSWPQGDKMTQASLAVGVEQGLQTLAQHAEHEDKKTSKKRPNTQKPQNKKSDDFVEDLVKMAIIKAIFN